MAIRQYKAVEKEFFSYDDYDDCYKESRFVIVDTETGEIMDDAQGYGYKTAVNAYRSFGYKLSHRRNQEKAVIA